MNFENKPSLQLGKTVVVLDPNEASRSQVLERLGRIGLQGLGASTFVELYNSLDKADLLVTEWQLEDFEGAALFRRLECDIRPTVLFTSHALDAEANAAWNGAGLKAAVAKPDKAQLLQEIVSLLSQDPGPSRCILLIEDSATVRNFLKRLFEREIPGVKIVEASEGRAALHEMTRCKADLIVTDLQMPGMDGRSFIAKLRSNSLLRKKSVMVLSSDEVSDLRALYRDDSGIRFLTKPSGSDEILKTALSLFAALPAAQIS
jgi:two-component system chemotaxis response regulator CheY